MSEKIHLKSPDTGQSSDQINISQASQPQDRSWSSYSSYLKKAVANVESQLDKVLESSTSDLEMPKNAKQTVETPTGSRLSMQDRLAMAVGRPSSSNSERKDNSSLNSLPNSGSSSTRNSLDQTSKPSSEPTNEPQSKQSNEQASIVILDPNLDPAISILTEYLSKTDQSSQQLTSLLDILEQQKDRMDQKNLNTSEQINSLESKLKYLSKLEIDRASRAKGSSTGIDKTLADKDEQIASLMVEGQELSAKELKHMNMIKKLRSKEKEYENSIQSYIKQTNKSEQEISSLKEKVKRLNQLEKETKKFDKDLVKKSSEIESLQKEKSSLESKITEYRQKITNLETINNEEKATAQNEEISKLNIVIEDMNSKLEILTNEKKLAQELHENEFSQLQGQLDEEIKCHSLKEIQMKEEINNLEAKAEHYRSLSENSRTKSIEKEGNIGHDGKLLRQIETLHAQHTAATENWHGIESNLMNRINSLETELDDIKEQHKDLRKRLKINTEGLRSRTEENEKFIEEIQNLEQEIKRLKQEISLKDEKINDISTDNNALKKKLTNLEDSNNELQKQLEDLELETQKQLSTPQATTSPSPFYNEISPPMNEIPFNIQTNNLSSFGQNSADDDRRRSSSLTGLHIMRSPSFVNNSETIIENETDDSMLGHSPSGLFPVRDSASRLDNSSVQTRTGGASLQLVSKMNFTIRRLEQESSAYKQDLEKMIRKKDEAYSEVARLMGQVEEMEKIQQESIKLKERVEMLEKREKTALEMLGEKSEQVNELRDDVKDLKEMYRQQIEQLANQLQEVKRR